MTHDELWEEKYKLAREYYEKHGNLMVLHNYKSNNINLGSWISTQRISYAKGNLCEYRINKLNAIGMIWSKSFELHNMNKWEKNYKLAKNYYEEHGDLIIPLNYKIDDVNLGIWLSLQRTLYRNNKLSEEKVNKLNKIGLEKCYLKITQLEIKWEENYKMAQEYYKQHGNLILPINYEISGVNLGSWLYTQRRKYKTGKLEKERIKKLNLIGMLWDVEKQGDISKINRANILYEQNSTIIKLLVNKYCESVLFELLLFDLDKEHVSNLDNLLRQTLTQMSYEIFILYMMGLSHKKISNIYKISEKEVEKHRLVVFKYILKYINSTDKVKIKKSE